MKAFTLAALPWILAGLAVAIICTGMDKQKSTKKEKEAEESKEEEVLEVTEDTEEAETEE